MMIEMARRLLFGAVLGLWCLSADLAHGEVVATMSVGSFPPEARLSPQRIRELEPRARSGDTDAAVALAISAVASHGANGFQDYRRWLEVAANEGHLAAQYDLYLCNYAVNCGNNGAKAMEWLERAANAGFPAAMHSLGGHYFVGNMGLPVSQEKGAYWLLRAAEANYPFALGQAAWQLAFGIKMPQDRARALDFAMRGAAADDRTAAVVLAIFYTEGWAGLPRDQVKAYEWNRFAAERGERMAMADLAVSLERGEGVAKNEKEAFQWLLRSASDDDYEKPNWRTKDTTKNSVKEITARSKILIARAYYFGMGVEKDCDEALKWINKGSAAESPRVKARAWEILGKMKIEGCGVEKDDVGGRQLLERAREHGIY